MTPPCLHLFPLAPCRNRYGPIGGELACSRPDLQGTPAIFQAGPFCGSSPLDIQISYPLLDSWIGLCPRLFTGLLYRGRFIKWEPPHKAAVSQEAPANDGYTRNGMLVIATYLVSVGVENSSKLTSQLEPTGPGWLPNQRLHQPV